MRKNEAVCFDGFCEIILCDRKGNEKMRTVIDENDKKMIEYGRWCVFHNKNGKNYAVTSKNNKLIFLHHVIIGRRRGYEVDHINGNGLDNRRKNLRFATHQQNAWNNLKAKGIYKHSSVEKWVAEIICNEKHYYLGLFSTEEEAIKARRQAELKFFGKFAPIR